MLGAMSHEPSHESSHEPSPEPDHEHSDDWSERYSQETWDARYAGADRVWSGRPNPTLVEHVADLPPGDALDIGSGEGADSVWLAERGWRVTALDVSPVALGRVAAHAAEAGVGERVTTLHHDLMDGSSVPGDHDLVTAHFMHVPRPVFADFHRRLGAAVRPGGALLVVGHHPDDVASGVRRPHGPDLLFTHDDVVAALGEEEWRFVVADSPRRSMATDDGPVTVRDAVVLAVRR